jgi:hypothetical protein
MIIVNLKGGLGNQMFQYAAGRRLAEIHKTELKLDHSFLLKQDYAKNVTRRNYELSIFNIKATSASEKEIKNFKNLKNRLMGKFFPGYHSNRYVKEKHFQFDKSILSLSDNRYLDGHWMSEKYFQEIEPLLREEFTFCTGVIESARSLEKKINESNSVCIQVRRGDYVNNPQVAEVHQTTTISYYKEAASIISKKLKDPVFFVFSDDSDWCIKNLGDLPSVHFVEKELDNTGASNSDYLQLMKQCKHFIISNSTFAWWGAWLSDNEKKIVIAPKAWFRTKNIVTDDIYPKAWLKI